MWDWRRALTIGAMAAARKWGLLELVLWDVILAAVAAVLVYVDQKEAAQVARELATPPPSASPTPAPPREIPRVTRATRATPTPRGPSEASLQAEFDRLADAARDKPPAEARRIYAGASARLDESSVWQRFLRQEETRLRAAEATDARRLLLRVRLRAAADRGDSTRLEALAARTPPDLIDLEAERAWAKRRAGGKPGGGLDLKGFSPDQASVEGRRCRVESWLGRPEADALRSVVDATLAYTGAALQGEPPALRAALLATPGGAPTGFELVTFARSDESAAERAERVRLLTASAALQRMHPGCLTRWSGHALAEALAGATLESQGPRATALGTAARAVFSQALPDGRGALVEGLLSRGPDLERDPTGAAATRFLSYALREREGRAALLWGALLGDVAGRAPLAKALPGRAPRLEAAFCASEQGP